MSENRNKKKKDLSRYYKQQDWMKPVGGALAIGGGLWFWLGYSVASYYGPGLLIPVGMFLFFFDAARHIGTNEIEELKEDLLRDFDRSVTDMKNYERTVLKQPSDRISDGYRFDETAHYFKRVREAGVVSDLFVRSHFFFTKDSLLICSREVSLSEMDPNTGTGFADHNERIRYADLQTVSLVKEEIPVTLTRSGNTVHARDCRLVLCLNDNSSRSYPVRNDVDADTLCEDINRLMEETKKQSPASVE